MLFRSYCPSLSLALYLSLSFLLILSILFSLSFSLPASLFVLQCIFIFMSNNHSSVLISCFFITIPFFPSPASVYLAGFLLMNLLSLHPPRRTEPHPSLTRNNPTLSRQQSLGTHAIFTGDDIRSLLMKKSAGKTNNL